MEIGSKELSVGNIVVVKNVTKIYKVGKVDTPALRGVSLKVRKGEFLAIMGPSGCGKTTLLHLIGGLLTPTSGRIFVDGQDITRMKDKERTQLRREKIGFIFQRYNLFPGISVRQNLELAKHIKKDGRDNGFIEEIIEMLGLKEKMDHKPLEISGGEQLRVAIARAVIGKPSIILADEPTGSLDSHNSQIVLDMLRNLNYKFNQTIVMITHNSEAAAYADRIIRMRDGQIEKKDVGSVFSFDHQTLTI